MELTIYASDKMGNVFYNEKEFLSFTQCQIDAGTYNENMMRRKIAKLAFNCFALSTLAFFLLLYIGIVK